MSTITCLMAVYGRHCRHFLLIQSLRVLFPAACGGLVFLNNRDSMKVILISLLFMFFIFTSGCSSGDTETYLKGLKSDNIVVRNDAIYHLGEKKEKSAVPALIKLLTSDQRGETKLSVIGALGKIREGSSVNSLVAALNEDDIKIKIAAIEALGKIKDPHAVQPLLNTLSDTGTRLFAIWALGNIGDKGAIPALTKLLGDDDKYVRYNASNALKKIGLENRSSR